jgi:hypothetical protein
MIEAKGSRFGIRRPDGGVVCVSETQEALYILGTFGSCHVSERWTGRYHTLALGDVRYIHTLVDIQFVSTTNSCYIEIILKPRDQR